MHVQGGVDWFVAEEVSSQQIQHSGRVPDGDGDEGDAADGSQVGEDEVGGEGGGGSTPLTGAKIRDA